MSETRATTILNDQGDVTIIWDEEDDEKMAAVIEKKMAEGMAFFIIEPRFGGVAAPSKTRLKRASDALKHRALAVRDLDFAGFIENSATAEPVSTPDAKVKTVRKTKSAKEASGKETVGVRPMRGG